MSNHPAPCGGPGPFSFPRMASMQKTGGCARREYSYDNGREGEEQRAVEAPPDQERGGEERSDGKSGLPPDSKDAHGCHLVLGGHIIHGTGGFRVIRRYSDAADSHDKKDEPVTWNNAGERNSQSRDQGSRWDKPRLGEPVCKMAEQGLDK